MQMDAAIFILKEMGNSEPSNVIKDAYSAAVVALEKQIQRSPIDTENGHICPSCKNHIIHEQQTMYCRQCGQLVRWA